MKDVKPWVQEGYNLSKMITKYIHIQTSSFQMLKSKIKSLDNMHVSMLFSRNIPPSPSPTESKSLFWFVSMYDKNHYNIVK